MASRSISTVALILDVCTLHYLYTVQYVLRYLVVPYVLVSTRTCMHTWTKRVLCLLGNSGINKTKLHHRSWTESMEATENPVRAAVRAPSV